MLCHGQAAWSGTRCCTAWWAAAVRCLSDCLINAPVSCVHDTTPKLAASDPSRALRQLASNATRHRKPRLVSAAPTGQVRRVESRAKSHFKCVGDVMPGCLDGQDDWNNCCEAVKHPRDIGVLFHAAAGLCCPSQTIPLTSEEFSPLLRRSLTSEISSGPLVLA